MKGEAEKGKGEGEGEEGRLKLVGRGQGALRTQEMLPMGSLERPLARMWA